MIGGSLVSWLLISAIRGSDWNPELALGMAAPLASAVLSWRLIERVHAVAPVRVTNVMIAGFIAKMLFFGLYFGLIAALGFRLRVFVVSFAVYFIALHALEAGYLRRLFASCLTSR